MMPLFDARISCFDLRLVIFERMRCLAYDIYNCAGLGGFSRVLIPTYTLERIREVGC